MLLPANMGNNMLFKLGKQANILYKIRTVIYNGFNKGK